MNIRGEIQKQKARKENMNVIKIKGDMFRSNNEEQVRWKDGKRHTSNSTKKVKHYFWKKLKYLSYSCRMMI